MKDYRLPAKFETFVFSFLLSCFMSLIVSGIAIFQAVGIEPVFMQQWLIAWLSSWVVAFPIVTVVAPLVEKLLPYFVKHD